MKKLFITIVVLIVVLIACQPIIFDDGSSRNSDEGGEQSLTLALVDANGAALTSLPVSGAHWELAGGESTSYPFVQKDVKAGSAVYLNATVPGNSVSFKVQSADSSYAGEVQPYTIAQAAKGMLQAQTSSPEGANFVFVMPRGAVTITLSYAPVTELTLTLSAAGTHSGSSGDVPNGSLSAIIYDSSDNSRTTLDGKPDADSTVKINSGAYVLLNANADEAYEISGMTVTKDGDENTVPPSWAGWSGGTNNTFVMPEYAVVVKPRFTAKIPFSVSASADIDNVTDSMVDNTPTDSKFWAIGYSFTTDTQAWSADASSPGSFNGQFYKGQQVSITTASLVNEDLLRTVDLTGHTSKSHIPYTWVDSKIAFTMPGEALDIIFTFRTATWVNTLTLLSDGQGSLKAEIEGGASKETSATDTLRVAAGAKVLLSGTEGPNMALKTLTVRYTNPGNGQVEQPGGWTDNTSRSFNMPNYPATVTVSYGYPFGLNEVSGLESYNSGNDPTLAANSMKNLMTEFGLYIDSGYFTSGWEAFSAGDTVTVKRDSTNAVNKDAMSLSEFHIYEVDESAWQAPSSIGYVQYPAGTSFTDRGALDAHFGGAFSSSTAGSEVFTFTMPSYPAILVWKDPSQRVTDTDISAWLEKPVDGGASMTLSFNDTTSPAQYMQMQAQGDTTNSGKAVWTGGTSFAAGSAYTTTFYLTAQSGWTFSGLGASSFTCSWADSISFSPLSNTEGSITVTYTLPAPAVTLISLSAPDLVYGIGEPFPNGRVVVTGTYSDGSTQTLTSGYTLSPSTLDTSKAAAATAISVSSGGKTTTFNATVQTFLQRFNAAADGDTITVYGNESIAAGISRTITAGSNSVSDYHVAMVLGSKTLTIDSPDAHTLTLSSAGSLFMVTSGGNLTMTGNLTLHGYSSNTVPVVYIEGGVFHMNGESITGNAIPSDETWNLGLHAAAVGINSGTFNLDGGGTISGNSRGKSRNGGGILVSGSGTAATRMSPGLITAAAVIPAGTTQYPSKESEKGTYL
jgi:hypothetical protein